MIKRVTVVHARPGMNRAEVLQYWKDIHGPLIAKVAGVKRYVQNHCTESARSRTEPPFLGVGEVWFDSREEADRTVATPEWRAAMADAATFMDMDRVEAGTSSMRQMNSASCSGGMHQRWVSHGLRRFSLFHKGSGRQRSLDRSCEKLAWHLDGQVTRHGGGAGCYVCGMPWRVAAAGGDGSRRGWRSHSDAWAGCIVWSTTASNSAVSASRSICWRRRATNVSTVRAAS
jgi:uncharacterized protein (TIGR02118 family)